jgi:hypothetical protein
MLGIRKNTGGLVKNPEIHHQFTDINQYSAHIICLTDFF